MLTEQSSFPEWLSRVKGGDQQAATDLVHHFEPVLLRVIRGRLGLYRLNGVIDPRDISQAVFGAFFRRCQVADLAIQSPEHLGALLATMARNKTHDEARFYLADRRDSRTVRALAHDELSRLQAPDPTPSKVVAGHELVEEMWRRFTEDERKLLELRSAGQSWAGIAREVGGQPEKLRKQLNRALHRVLGELLPEG